MTLRKSSTPAELALLSHDLSARLGLAEGALGGVLLEWVNRSDALFGIKDVVSGRYVWVNERLATLFGTDIGGVIGRSDAELLDPEPAAAMRAAEQTALGQTTPSVSEHRIERDRRRREFSVTRVLLPRAHEGVPQHLCSIWSELTVQRQREAQLNKTLQQLETQQQAIEALRRETQDEALRDNLTGLYQRAHFDDQLRREIDLSSREHREFALVSVQLDALTPGVAARGEEAHRRVLEALGRLLRGNTRAMDASCRIDDDRFAVLLSGVGLATAHSRMEGLRRQCATQIVVLNGEDLGFTVSMGVASFPHTAQTREELLEAIDVALAEAQRRGGNHVALASIRFEG
ncbi:MAG: hypothetical protein RJA98_1661 [Pseudomonadota bacterium]|jgi:diguanylate cyclase (GGDEF)-like protein